MLTSRVQPGNPGLRETEKGMIGSNGVKREISGAVRSKKRNGREEGEKHERGDYSIKRGEREEKNAEKTSDQDFYKKGKKKIGEGEKYRQARRMEKVKKSRREIEKDKEM